MMMNFGMGFGILFWIFVLAALYYLLIDKKNAREISPAALDFLCQRRDRQRRVPED
jgi:hypothetical protein